MYTDTEYDYPYVKVAQIVSHVRIIDEVTTETHNNVYQNQNDSFIKCLNYEALTCLKMLEKVKRKDSSHTHANQN